MSERSSLPQTSAVGATYQDGQSAGLAIAAVALAIAAFVNLLGIEKSLLAGGLAILALRGARNDHTARRRGWLAVALSAAHIVTVVTVLVLFHDKLGQLILLLHKLS